MPSRRTPTPPSSTATVWISWQSAEGSKTTQGELQNLNDNGYAVLRIAASDTLWIPLRRIYCISTQRSTSAEAAFLQEQTAAEAAAVIQAVAEKPISEA